jgi:tRNA(fMet)-specific endonuclease VapC
VTLRYLLDTNLFAELMRLSPNAQVLANFHKYQTGLATAAIVLHELQFGCDRLPPSSKHRKLAKFINDVVKAKILSFPMTRMHLFGTVRNGQGFHSWDKPLPS